MADNLEKISMTRTEQWEYTASAWGISATGRSKQSAEYSLLLKRLAVMNKQVREAAEKMRDESDYCWFCDNHFSSGHDPNCIAKNVVF